MHNIRSERQNERMDLQAFQKTAVVHFLFSRTAVMLNFPPEINEIAHLFLLHAQLLIEEM